METAACQQPAQTLPPADDQNDGQRSQFLYQAITDTQSTIRYLDAKAAIALAPLGFMIAEIIDEIGVASLARHANWWQIVCVLFSATSAACVFVAAQVILPRSNPMNYVDLVAGTGPAFFVVALPAKKQPWWSAFLDSKHLKSVVPHCDYLTRLRSATPTDLNAVLSGEVLKLSWIRDLKHLRLRWVAICLALSALLFLALLTGRVPAAPSSVVCSTPPPVPLVAQSVPLSKSSVTALGSHTRSSRPKRAKLTKKHHN